MKNLYIVLCALLCTTVSQAQTDDSLSIIGIYDDFQNTILEKEVAAHTALYISEEAPVYNVNKHLEGPQFMTLLNVDFWTYYFSQEEPYSLDISEIELVMDPSFAITKAHFEEYTDESFSSSGEELLGYIKTVDGWKLAFLHHTVVFAGDSNDYSVPYTLNNSVSDVVEDFVNYFNEQDGQSMLELFVQNSDQVIAYDGELSDEYNPENHDILDYSIELSASIEERILTISNQEVHILDDYIAAVFCDYKISLDDEVEENGRAYFTLIANAEDGWQLSSFIRDSASLITEIKEENKSDVVVFPNPAINDVVIHADEGIGIVEILDELGRRVDVYNAQNQIELRINSNKYGDGYYILRIQLSNNEFVNKNLIIR